MDSKKLWTLIALSGFVNSSCSISKLNSRREGKNASGETQMQLLTPQAPNAAEGTPITASGGSIVNGTITHYMHGSFIKNPDGKTVLVPEGDPIPLEAPSDSSISDEAFGLFLNSSGLPVGPTHHCHPSNHGPGSGRREWTNSGNFANQLAFEAWEQMCTMYCLAKDSFRRTRAGQTCARGMIEDLLKWKIDYNSRWMYLEGMYAQICFSGGDQGHRQKMVQLKDTILECFRILEVSRRVVARPILVNSTNLMAIVVGGVIVAVIAICVTSSAGACLPAAPVVLPSVWQSAAAAAALIAIQPTAPISATQGMQASGMMLTDSEVEEPMVLIEAGFGDRVMNSESQFGVSYDSVRNGIISSLDQLIESAAPLSSPLTIPPANHEIELEDPDNETPDSELDQTQPATQDSEVRTAVPVYPTVAMSPAPTTAPQTSLNAPTTGGPK